jgi:pimeloyl-ACP methyl ester carboxylesterase
MRFGAGWLCAALTAAACGAPWRAYAQPAPIERCRLTTDSLPAAFARCATISVPEDPARPAGATVDVFVARIAAAAATPRPDPLLIISGGPGQSAVDFYLQTRGAFEPTRRDRDLILVDQRGTGRSAAGFACDVPADLALDTAGPAELGRYVDGCVAALEHDPRLYTTSVAVQDLERVRAALGIERWNVYGVSYGTRVAQHYLRRFPERVRALVLDGVVPPALALGPDVAPEAERALERIFARCATDARCGDTFPELGAHFHELLARLDGRAAAPSGAPRRLTGAELRAVVRFFSYNAATAALLPVLLSEAYSGNEAPLLGQSDTTLRDLPEALSFPMSNSVVCTEDVPFLTAGTDERLEHSYLGTAIVDALRAICARWPAGAIDADFKTPVTASQPALLLSGGNDPITPPEYAEQVIAGGLRNAVHLVGPDQGHGLVTVGCVPRLLRSFLEKPIPAELDGSCLAAEPVPPFFLSLLGPAP